jgi:hypothetical protein
MRQDTAGHFLSMTCRNFAHIGCPPHPTANPAGNAAHQEKQSRRPQHQFQKVLKIP